MAVSETDLVGIYRRTISAGIERIWENVRDWEHLPWLHAEAFTSVSLIEQGEPGWTADVGFSGGGRSRVRVALEVAKFRYTTSTLSGDAAGTDIVTVLQPKGDNVTDIEVSFHVPGVSKADRSAMFEIYRDIYAQLWDEDEAMMRERQSVLDERVSSSSASGSATTLKLGDKSELLKSLPKIVSVAGTSFRLIEVDGEIVAHSIRCPHLGGPLGEGECADGAVTCPWHGYRFEVHSGKCVSGQKFRLAAAPLVAVDEATDTVSVSFAG